MSMINIFYISLDVLEKPKERRGEEVCIVYLSFITVRLLIGALIPYRYPAFLDTPAASAPGAAVSGLQFEM